MCNEIITEYQSEILLSTVYREPPTWNAYWKNAPPSLFQLQFPLICYVYVRKLLWYLQKTQISLFLFFSCLVIHSHSKWKYDTRIYIIKLCMIENMRLTLQYAWLCKDNVKIVWFIKLFFTQILLFNHIYLQKRIHDSVKHLKSRVLWE